MRGSVTEPAALTAASAATVPPEGSTALAVPMPPLRPPATAPVPAPVLPWATGAPGPVSAAAAAAARPSAASGRARQSPPRPRSKRAAAGTTGYDLRGVGADPEAAAPLLQPGGDTGRGVKAEGAAAGQHDRLDALDEVARVERVGLPGAGAAAAYVDGRDGTALGCQDDGGAGQAAAAGALGVADPEAEDVGQGVLRPRGVRRVLSDRPVPSR